MRHKAVCIALTLLIMASISGTGAVRARFPCEGSYCAVSATGIQLSGGVYARHAMPQSCCCDSRPNPCKMEESENRVLPDYFLASQPRAESHDTFAMQYVLERPSSFQHTLHFPGASWARPEATQRLLYLLNGSILC